MDHSIIIGFVIVVIVCLQLYFFIENIRKMNEFKTIFYSKDNNLIKFTAHTGSENGEIQGVTASSNNRILKDILEAINTYIKSNRTKSIKFELLKDSVDRNCESVEEDINTLNPLPLYLGLVGTMAGIIVGIVYLWATGGLSALLDTSQDATLASDGISALLSGIAIAMISSILGIVFTIINSWRFKGCKSMVEKGRNDFLVWIQSKLLPVIEYSNDTLSGMNKLIARFEYFTYDFNDRFVANMGKLNSTLEEINRSYEIIQSLDVVKMSEANAKVFSKLKKCTDNLDEFVTFFESINTLRNKWEREVQSSKAFNKLGEYFKAEHEQIETRKALMTESIENVDKNLSLALEKLNSTFENRSKEMSNAFNEQLKRLPQLHQEFQVVSTIPALIEKAMESIKKSNDSINRRYEDTFSRLNRNLEFLNDGLDRIANNETSFGGNIKSKSIWEKIIAIGVILLVLLFSFYIVKDMFFEKSANVITIDETNTTETPTNIITIKEDSIFHNYQKHEN